MDRYLEQARRDYAGKPDATAFVVDDCGERVALVRMRVELKRGKRGNHFRHYVLAWVGAELADSPDEMEIDELPAGWRARWRKL